MLLTGAIVVFFYHIKGRSIMKSVKAKLLIPLVCSILATPSLASVYDFYAITSYTNTGYQSVVHQLSMEVGTVGATSATLVFYNTGSIDCTVASIYFDYASEAYALNAGATGWTYGTPQPSLPGGDGVFETDFYLLVDPPPTKNGISIGESLELTLNYDSGFNLLESLDTADLRIGLHTIGIFDTEGRVITELDDPEEGNVGEPWTYSESSINVIPEPGSLALLAGASSLILFFRRRQII